MRQFFPLSSITSITYYFKHTKFMWLTASDTFLMLMNTSCIINMMGNRLDWSKALRLVLQKQCVSKMGKYLFFWKSIALRAYCLNEPVKHCESYHLGIRTGLGDVNIFFKTYHSENVLCSVTLGGQESDKSVYSSSRCTFNLHFHVQGVFLTVPPLKVPDYIVNPIEKLSEFRKGLVLNHFLRRNI